MGFRSTLISEQYYVEVPEWFSEKYKDDVEFLKSNDKPLLSFARVHERKYYSNFNEDELFTDVQKVLKELDIDKFIIVLLHECGGITRIEITKDTVMGNEPIEWKKVDGVEHDYCYGCSDI